MDWLRKSSERMLTRTAPGMGLSLALLLLIGGERPVIAANLQPDELSCGPGFELSYPESSYDSCFISSAELKSSTAQRRVVDVRPDNSLPISDALTISPGELLRKPFLKDQSLLLVGTGFGSVQKMIWCQRFEAAGFKSVRYLHGGDRAYGEMLNDSGGLLVAEAGVSPSNFWSELHNGDVYVVALGESTQAALKRLGVTNELLADDELESVAQLSVLSRTRTENKLGPIVLIGDNQSGAKELAAGLQLINLFYLDKGIEGLETFVDQQAAVIRQRNKSVSRGLMCNA